MSKEQDGIQQLDTQEVLKLYKEASPDVELIDVRENAEYNAGHIPGIKLIPTSEFMVRYEQELDPDQAYVFVCRSGNRSQMVCQFLQENGYEKCSNYTQGMLDWSGPQDQADKKIDLDNNRW